MGVSALLRLFSSFGGNPSERSRMARKYQFSALLPIIEFCIATAFGGVGLRQRYALLSRPLFQDQTLLDTTARFHIWPWPYKFAVIANLPAFFAGSITSAPLQLKWPAFPEYLEALFVLIFVPFLWYWIGRRFDRRWQIVDKMPWAILAAFTLLCLAGASLHIGYTGFLPYGFVVWVIAVLLLTRSTYTCSGIPRKKTHDVGFCLRPLIVSVQLQQHLGTTCVRLGFHQFSQFSADLQR